MKRCCVGICLLGLLALPVAVAQAGEKSDEWKPIAVSWHGQSFFTIKTSAGKQIAIDPHMIPEYGRQLGLKADLVLISHNHNDHNRVEVFENSKDKNLQVIAGLKGTGLRGDWNRIDTTVGDIHIRSVSTYHDDMEGLQSGKNTVFVIEVDGWRIAHLGDLGHLLTPAQLKQIGPVDVLMIPVGGIYTLNGNDAKKVVEQIRPKEYIFPMHCGTKIYDELLPATEFLEDQDRRKVAVSDDNKVTLNRDPQRPRPLIVQLNYWPKAAERK